MEEILRAIKIQTVTKLSIEDLVNDYNEQVWRFCRSLTYSKEDAEDLLQETFLRVLEQLPKINASDNPKNFLFSTAVYLRKSKKRKYARRERLVNIQPLNEDVVVTSDENIEDDIISQEDTRIIQELVQDLPEKIRIPITLYYTMEMSLADIAETLKLPVGTVKSRLHKARKIIEKGLIGVGYGK